MVSPFSGPKERMPWIIIRSILDMMAAVCGARTRSFDGGGQCQAHASSVGEGSVWACTILVKQ